MIQKYINKLFCKHKITNSSSCPFTGKTYTFCEKCMKNIKTEKTS